MVSSTMPEVGDVGSKTIVVIQRQEENKQNDKVHSFSLMTEEHLSTNQSLSSTGHLYVIQNSLVRPLNCDVKQN